MRRSSRSQSPRRSWASARIYPFCARRGARCASCSRSCLSSPGFTGRRRAKLTETIEWLIGIFAEQSPGYRDDLVLIDSTPVECARSVETVRRSALSDAAGYGYCRSHSRWFYGFRLHLVAAPDGTPRAAILAGADTQRTATSRCACCRARCTAASS